MSKRRGEAVINETLDLRVYFRRDSTGELFDPYSISKVEILDSDCSTVLETITSITKISTGYYKVITASSWNTTSKIVYDRWTFKLSSDGDDYTSLESTYIFEIETPATELIDKDDVKEFLKIASGTTTHDALITSLTNKVISFIKTYINREIDETTYYQLYDGNNGIELMLDNYPIVEIDVLSQSVDNTNKTYSDTIDTDNILVRNYDGIIELFTETFGLGQRSIYIEYKAGYGGSGDNAIAYPEDLKLVAVEMCSKKFYDSEEKRFGINSKNIMGDNIVFSFKDITDQQKEILDRYKKPVQKKYGINVSQYTAE